MIRIAVGRPGGLGLSVYAPARSARGWGRVLAGGASGGARRWVGDRHCGRAFPADQSAARPGWGRLRASSMSRSRRAM